MLACGRACAASGLLVLLRGKLASGHIAARLAACAATLLRAASTHRCSASFDARHACTFAWCLLGLPTLALHDCSFACVCSRRALACAGSALSTLGAYCRMGDVVVAGARECRPGLVALRFSRLILHAVAHKRGRRVVLAV